MNWNTISDMMKPVAPALARALGGPASAIVGPLLAERLGAKHTPADVAVALGDTKSLGTKTIISALERDVAAIPELTANPLPAAERRSDHWIIRTWRPAIAFAGALTFMIYTLVGCVIAFANPGELGVFVSLVTASVPIYGLIFAVAGITAAGRSLEKIRGRQ